MRSFICTLAFITASISLVSAATSNCNYVVDYFWTSVQAPSSAPTEEPSPAPTTTPTDSPSAPPSPAPTSTGNITSTTYEPTLIMMIATTQATDKISINVGGGDNEADESILKPLSLDYCYSFPDTHFYHGDFSLKYECNANNYLVRNIYYESLTCDSSTVDSLTVETYKQGTYDIKYVCGQASNCNYAILTNATATTPSPTPAPTSNPTKSPSDSPTLAPSSSPFHVGTEYPSTSNIISVTSLFETTERDTYIVYGGGDDGYWWDDCDGISEPPNRDSASEIEYHFPHDICVPASFFSDVFGFTVDDFPYCSWGSSCTLAQLSFGWICDPSTNQYLMGVFKDTSCSDLDDILIVYTDDMCIPKIASNDYYTPYWTYIECGVSDSITTVSPTEGGSVPSPTVGSVSVSTPSPSIGISLPSASPTIGDPTASTSPTLPTVPTVAEPTAPTAPTLSPTIDLYSMAACHVHFICTFVICITGLYLLL